MPRAFVIFAVFALITVIILVQKFGPSAADAQISFYQSQIDADCRAEGRKRGSTAEIIDSFCSCMSKTLKQHVSNSDWERAYTFALQGRHADEVQVLDAYRNHLEACR